MTYLDWSVICAYFMLLAGVAWWVIQKNKSTTDDYFLAGRDLGWLIVGASIFASNIGSEHLVGLAGSGCTDGVAMAHYELHAWCLLVLAWVFVPFYMRSKVFTMPEFLGLRFNETARLTLSIISIIAFILTKIAVGIYAGGVVFRTLLPGMHLNIGFMVLDSFWIGSIIVVILTGFYTMIGGMRTVAYTEALQTVILIIGSLLITIYGLMALGGWSELHRLCGSNMFNLWKPLIPSGMEGTWAPVKETSRIAWYFNGNYPWLGMLFCAPVIGLWYWCTDQYIVQRALGAPNETEARRGSIWAAYLKLLPVFIFIIPGMICFALASSGKVPALTDALYTTGQLDNDKAQAAYPLMVKLVLPSGLRGIVVAGLLAALMSSLAGVFNACSTLFTMDFYTKFHPTATQKQLVWIGRVAVAGMILISLLWIPVIQGSRGLYTYLQGMQGYIAPPFFVAFFLGVFMKRTNSTGCMACLVIGFILGMIRLAIDTPVTMKLAGFEHGYTEGSWLWIINNIYFQYYSVLIVIVCTVVMIGFSYLTPAPDAKKICGLTYGTMTDEHRQESRNSWDWREVTASVCVVLMIITAYVYFTG